MLEKVFKLRASGTSVGAQVVGGATTLALPAFLTTTITGYTMEMREGNAFAFISCSFLKLAMGHGKKVHWLLYLLSVLFILRFVFLRG